MRERGSVEIDSAPLQGMRAVFSTSDDTFAGVLDTKFISCDHHRVVRTIVFFAPVGRQLFFFSTGTVCHAEFSCAIELPDLHATNLLRLLFVDLWCLMLPIPVSPVQAVHATATEAHDNNTVTLSTCRAQSCYPHFPCTRQHSVERQRRRG